MRWLRALLGPALALGCGPIGAPSGVLHLGAGPVVATREELFDRLGSLAVR